MMALPSLAAEMETLTTDLLPQIREAASRSGQFAVNLPHAVSAVRSGQWTRVGAVHRWTYAVHVPDAVSLSFHASRLVLPPSAVLQVRSAATTATYRASDTRDDFWSRVQVGDSLELALEVAASESTQVVLEISSLQVGFRGLSPDVPSHPLLGRVQPQAAGDPDTQCVENYACHVTTANDAAGRASVALLIGNTYLCTGTLINNTSHDNTPYIITARHCQNGVYGGGNPAVASTVTVYWNALSACGMPLGSVLYDAVGERQIGARTVVEQQDHWLMRLDSAPAADNAVFAGFDASPGPVIDGYTVHFALAYHKQFTRWQGQAWASSGTGVLGTSFNSDMLDVINGFGVTGPGASGAALFSNNDRILGVMSLAKHSGTLSRYNICPLPAPPVPDSTNGPVSFNALSGVWNSMADQTSTTGALTLQSVLDPGNTGAISAGSVALTPMSFRSSVMVAPPNSAVTLTWDGGTASQCIASGGISGDGWNGAVPVAGMRSVTNPQDSEVSYSLRCDFAGIQIARSLNIRWETPLPSGTSGGQPSSGGPSSDGGGGGTTVSELLLAALLGAGILARRRAELHRVAA